jgi:hypothetical protein
MIGLKYHGDGMFILKLNINNVITSFYGYLNLKREVIIEKLNINQKQQFFYKKEIPKKITEELNAMIYMKTSETQINPFITNKENQIKDVDVYPLGLIGIINKEILLEQSSKSDKIIQNPLIVKYDDRYLDLNNGVIKECRSITEQLHYYSYNLLNSHIILQKPLPLLTIQNQEYNTDNSVIIERDLFPQINLGNTLDKKSSSSTLYRLEPYMSIDDDNHALTLRSLIDCKTTLISKNTISYNNKLEDISIKQWFINKSKVADNVLGDYIIKYLATDKYQEMQKLLDKYDGITIKGRKINISNDNELKQAYRKIAVKTHPDKTNSDDNKKKQTL